MTTAEAEYQKLERELMQKGFEEAREEGRKEGMRRALTIICGVYDIPLTPARKRQLEAMEMDALLELHAYLLKHRRWPTRRR